MIQLIPVFLGATLVIAAIWLAGRAVAIKLPPSLSFGVGGILISYFVFALMLLHRANRALLIVVLFGCIVTGVSRGARFVLVRPPLWVLGLCTPFAVWYLVNALAPEVLADPNVYHLKPAVDALKLGGFSNWVTFYDRLPQAVELLFVPAFALGGSSAAKLVHFAFFLASLAAIGQLARRLELPGDIAAAMYFCTPIVALAGTAAFNDAALVYFTVASVALALDDEPFYAGLFAGFCYAIKMTGMIAVPVALVFFLVRRQWRSALICGAAATLTISPWLLRNWVQTGNPFAPFFNAWFPNPYFYVLIERALMVSLRDYGVPFWHRFSEVLVGNKLHGLIGPAFIAAPLALLAVRRKSGALIVGLALVFSISWWMNAGARFLMPALPFLALAICAVLPRRAAIALLLIHAITSWPTVVTAYSPLVLRLASFPWKAALRIEREEEYLTRVSDDYRYAKMAEQNTPPQARILDLIGAHGVFIDRELIGSWGSATGVRLLQGLEFARQSTLTLREATFEPRPVCGYRIIETADTSQLWNLHSVELHRDGKRVEGGMASASTNLWDLPLAFDRNLVSRWSTGKPAERGFFVQVDFPQPAIGDSVQVLYPTSDSRIEMRIETCYQGRWERVQSRTKPGPVLNFRPSATAMLRKAGITHILTPAGSDGMGLLGERLINEADLWDLEPVSSLYAVYLLKVR